MITIIVPIYGVEKYLKKCIDSILCQSHSNIELLLIDDGSPDDCPQICDDYAKKDKRVVVIHRVNGGVSDARNAGLESAKGGYIAFVDPDDYIDEKFIQILLETALINNADISVCSYSKVHNSMDIRKRKHFRSMNFNNIEAMRDVFSQNSSCEVMPCNKLYKTELFRLNDITYPIGKIYEDDFTTFKLFYYSKVISYVNKYLYFYVQRPGSTMHKGFSKTRLDKVEAANHAAKWVDDHDLLLTYEVMEYQFATILYILNNMIDENSFDKDIWEQLSAWVLSNKRQLLNNDILTKKQTMLIYVVQAGKWPYTNLRKIYTKKRRLQNEFN